VGIAYNYACRTVCFLTYILYIEIFGLDNDIHLQPNACVTDKFSNELKIQLDDMELVIMHAPGECRDEVIVWWPEEKVLFPADNIYKSFPNLYTIRGAILEIH
jgi:hypothetical protein